MKGSEEIVGGSRGEGPGITDEFTGEPTIFCINNFLHFVSSSWEGEITTYLTDGILQNE